MSNPHLNLGYCCLNTVLREDNVFCSRTMRLATFKEKGLAYAQELALQNLQDMLPIIEWNEKNGIKLFRVSSDIFPLASHPNCLYSLDFAQPLLKQIGDLARKYGHRLTMHPSQHHVLTNKNEKTFHHTALGLDHHADILDRMGVDSSAVMVIHGGGVYGNKAEALKTFEENFMKLKESTRNRLVLENDEMAYTIEDLLPTSQKLKIPIVIDYHHDLICPSSKPAEGYHAEVFAVWDERGIKPKVHVSQSPMDVDMSSKTARRKHGDYIDVLPDSLLSLNRDVDVMFEAKMKEQAVLRYRGIISGEIKTDRTTFEVPMTLTVEEMKEEKKLLKKTKSPSKTKALCEECSGEVVEMVKVERKVIAKKKTIATNAAAKTAPKKAAAKAVKKAAPKKKAPRGMWVDMAVVEEHKRIKKLIREAVKEPKGPTTSSEGQPQSAADLPQICEPSGSTSKPGRRATAPKRTAPKPTPAKQVPPPKKRK